MSESKFETFYVGTRVGTGCPVSSLFLIVVKHSTALLAHNFLLYLRYKMVSDGVNWSKYVHTHISGIQSVNTTPFCASPQVL